MFVIQLTIVFTDTPIVTLDTSKFMDGRVQFTNTGVKGYAGLHCLLRQNVFKCYVLIFKFRMLKVTVPLLVNFQADAYLYIYFQTIHIDLNKPGLESVTHIVILVPTSAKVGILGCVCAVKPEISLYVSLIR